MVAHIKDFNLITEAEIQRLSAAGVRTCSQLIEKASTSSDRMRLADQINMDDSDLKNLTHHCDMMRVDGMTPSLAVSLCGIGVSTVPKLAYQNALSLQQRLNTAPDATIDKRTLEKLIASAKTLPKMIRH
jgi:hypothetical protein